MDSMQSNLVLLTRYTKALSVALGYRHVNTKLHSERVGTLAVSFGEVCGLPGDELEMIRLAATFHDIGKLGIPDSILSKPGRLEDDERMQMQRHPEIGADILMATELPGSEEAAQLILHHHERFDGTGYPHKLAGNDIPLGARLIGIADSYDAMFERRAYHEGRRHSEIIDVLGAERGSKHDPDLLDVCIKALSNQVV